MRLMLQAIDALTGSQDAGDHALKRLQLSRAGVVAEKCKLEQDSEPLFLSIVCDHLGDNSLGARAGLALKTYTTLNAYIVKYSRTLQDAIENSTKYYTLIDPDAGLGLRISSNVASFEVALGRPSLLRFPRFIEFVMFSALGRMRSITGVAFHPMQMRLVHQARDVAPVIEEIAGFPVVFGAERCEILMSRSTLDLAIPTYDPSLRDHLKRYGNALISEQRKGDGDLRTRIEGILAANLPGHIVAAEDMASNLGMSRRTFARRLSEQGLSYREIVDDLRSDLARTYLKDGFGIAEIAFYLDYADQAAFSTAFKRWTGMSPSVFRAELPH